MTYVSDMFGLNGKVALVTGGTGVLGKTMCKALARAGAKVVIIGRRGDVAESLAAEIKTNGGEAIGISADVLKHDQLKKAKTKIMEHFGAINILINAAGGNSPGATVLPDQTFNDLKIDEFQKVVELNLTGTVLPSQVFGEAMMVAKSGVIINISSMTALRPLSRVVGYGTGKAAVTNFTKWLAVEMARKFGEGIRVNAIAPGFFLTDINRKMLINEDKSLTERGSLIIKGTPFGRFGEPGELSGTLIWLCSDASKFVSGIVVPVDGGFTAYAGV